MEGDVISLTQGIALDLWARAEIFLRSLMRPWNGYQVGIALGFFVVAHLLNRLSVWMLVQAIIVIGALFALARFVPPPAPQGCAATSTSRPRCRCLWSSY